MKTWPPFVCTAVKTVLWAVQVGVHPHHLSFILEWFNLDILGCKSRCSVEPQISTEKINKNRIKH